MWSELFSRKTAVIHIGTHKTGTTSFQKVLHESRDQLRSHGILLATDDNSGLSTVLAQLVVRTELQPPFRLSNPDINLTSRQRKFRRHIRRQVASNYDTLVFSHEALSFVRTAREVRTLRRLMFPRKVRIVVTVRSPHDFLNSWRLTLSRGWDFGLSELDDSFMNTRADSWLAKFDDLISVYVAGFGKSNVTIVDYDHELRVNGDVVPNLWSVCGLPPALIHNRPITWENRTPKP